MTSTDLEPVTGEIERTAPLLPMDVHAAETAMSAYQELCGRLLIADDWIGRPGERESFVKRSGWQKLATFYGVSTEFVERSIERDDDGKIARAYVLARAIHPDGRHADGDGACGANEPRFANARGRQKIEHDLPATAATRATNRAISNLIGFGAVSAEEIDADVRANTSRAGALPDWATDVLNDPAADRFGDNVEAILTAAAGGVVTDERGVDALRLANELVTYCDGTLPTACARLARLLVQAITPQPASPERDTPAPAPTTPPEGAA